MSTEVSTAARHDLLSWDTYVTESVALMCAFWQKCSQRGGSRCRRGGHSVRGFGLGGGTRGPKACRRATGVRQPVLATRLGLMLRVRARSFDGFSHHPLPLHTLPQRPPLGMASPAPPALCLLVEPTGAASGGQRAGGRRSRGTYHPRSTPAGHRGSVATAPTWRFFLQVPLPELLRPQTSPRYWILFISY